jgi:hypothetical protein
MQYTLLRPYVNGTGTPFTCGTSESDSPLSCGLSSRRANLTEERPAAMLGSIPARSSSLQLISCSDTVLRSRPQNRVLQSVQETGCHAGQHTRPLFIPARLSGSDRVLRIRTQNRVLQIRTRGRPPCWAAYPPALHPCKAQRFR